MNRAVLAAFGDELLSGLRLERNCNWFASKLHDAGWKVMALEILPDREEAIDDFLSRWVGNVDLIVTSGGLGSTHDDRTRFGFARHLNSDLQLDDKAYDLIVQRYQGHTREIIERSRSTQALIPADALSLYNPEGSGLGIFFRKKGTRVFAFPGIPSEYMAMAEKEILCNLDHQGYWTRIHITGWAESMLKDQLEQFTSNKDLHISILPSFNLIEIVLRGEETTVRTAERKIRTELADDVLPFGIFSLPEALYSEALRTLTTFSFAESCTGGLLGATLTDIAGVSEVFRGSAVCYSNESKICILDVPREVISVHGAVSEECALSMAEGARERFDTDYSLAVTGIAGPDGGSPDKPVGTVWIGVCSSEKASAEEFLFSGTREMIRKRALFKGIELLWRCIKDDGSWI